MTAVVTNSVGSERLPCLDGLRALSIVIVLIGHFFYSGRGGGAALDVYVFFVISGFLITSLLFQERKKSGSVAVFDFYVRRFFRLFPVLALYVFVVLVCAFVLEKRFSFFEVFSVAFYFTNYYMSYLSLQGAELVLPFGVLWSLAVEEHFYLFMPLVFLATKNSKGLLRAAVVVVFGSLFIRFLYVHFFPEFSGKLVSYRNSETRFDSIAFGVCLASICELYGVSAMRRYFSSPWIFWFGLGLMLLCGAIPGAYYKETVRFSLISFGALLVVASAVFGRRNGIVFDFLNSSPVVYVGKLSYSLYIWHGGVELFYRAAGFEVLGDWGGAKLLLTFAVAYFSFNYVEAPMIAFGRRFLNRGGRAQLNV